jgi:hypothetical protein
MPGGTRFLLFPQYAQGLEPEEVEIDLPPGAIGPGPQDRTMYVANAIAKPLPYRVPDRLPPYGGPLHSPAMPGPDGHFVHISKDSPQYRAAHLYGVVRRVLDLWKDLLGQPIVWWHAAEFPQLELVPWLRWGNAHAGPGYLETGMLWTHNGVPQDLSLNFDVAAHEVGHIILFSILGAPTPGHLTGEFLAFHEAFADHVAAISSLYFRSVARRLLVQTRGNLYALNLVSRLGELSGNDQVRVLDNDVRMSHLAGLRLGPDGNWIDPLGLGRNQHAAAAPLSGAFWDCLVELYQDRLVARGAIGPRLDTRRWTEEEVEEALGPLQSAMGASLERFQDDFFAALQAARDLTGLLLARCVQRLHPDDLDFATVAARFCEALVELGQGHILPAFVDNFVYRGIDPRPLLRGVAAERGAPPLGRAAAPGLRGIGAVGRLIQHPHRESVALAGG